jgi:GT2 family glycosyltransferase
MPLPLIIIPVFNALEQLEACLESVSRTVPDTTRILLIDDASTDPRVVPLLQSFADEAKSYRGLLKHEVNRGFVATVNHGMRLAGTDVVLLNSDTQVTSGWLGHLADCLASDASIATATPWSNNGEIVSIPHFCAVNPVPGDADAVAAVIASCGKPIYPQMPTAVGFCMAISLRAIDRVGLFDEVAFGRGYGEENDFCRRVEQAGFRNVLCDNAYVVHHGGASFGPLGLKPDEKSMQSLLAKHPQYLQLVSEFIRSDPFAPRRQELVDCLKHAGLTGITGQ